MEELNVFDFDDTIYDGDSSIDFYLFCLKNNILLIRYLPIQLYGMIAYKLRIKSKEYFKEKYFSFLKGIQDIDTVVEKFWNCNNKRIRLYLLKNKQNIVIISASPDFLLEPIGRQIGANKVIATRVNRTTGEFISKNCYGKEKVNRLNREYKNYIISEFYSDSSTDKYLAQVAKRSFLVKKGKIVEWDI